MARQPTRARVNPQRMDTTPKRRPPWLKVRAPVAPTVREIRRLMRGKALHTVCEEALCPNLGECWGHGTATFLMLGDVCTRTCGFCDVKHGVPQPVDWEEADRIADAVATMGLDHAVITSVNRDDRGDGGAPLFAMVIQRIRERVPTCSIEVLIPDFKGRLDALRIVMDARPDILNHNVETVPRLFRLVQPQDRYEWARRILTAAKAMDPTVLTKSGIMVGLGETMDEVKATLEDLRSWGVDIVTIGQYLQPSRHHLPIARYYHPDEFEELREFGYQLGFKWVESGPLVRSSYRAAEQVRALSQYWRGPAPQGEA